jgi:hypothetical protein
MMMMTSRPNRLLLSIALSWLLQPSRVEAGIFKGFHKKVPLAEELWPTFRQTTRYLFNEKDFPTGPRGGVRDASPKIEPTEVSFMIVSPSGECYRSCLFRRRLVPTMTFL